MKLNNRAPLAGRDGKNGSRALSLRTQPPAAPTVATPNGRGLLQDRLGIAIPPMVALSQAGTKADPLCPK
eukprot:1648840-Amphidinium_carterae.1